MKANNLIIALLLLFICFSCEEQNDNFKQYANETIYPGRIDSLRTYVGIEKIYFGWDKPTDFKSQKIVVEYDSEKIITDEIVDTLIVTGLNSGKAYNFEIFSIDTNNNESLRTYANLFPVSQDWIDKNMLLSKPLLAPSDGVSVESLTLSWPTLNNEVMKYKDGLEYTLKDSQGNVITSNISVNNDVDNGVLSIILGNLMVNEEYTFSYSLLFSPLDDNVENIDTTPITGEVTFSPDDFSLDPIYLLVQSIGWDTPSFIELKAIEPGKFLAKNINLIANDIFRAFDEPRLDAEKQYGFSFFNSIPSFIEVSNDGNDNLQLSIQAGVFDLVFDTATKDFSATGTFNGLAQIPGTVEMEDYNVGGNGLAYFDADFNNNGGQYRPNESVDISNGPVNVGWTRDGEWLTYTVEVLTTGDYLLDFSVASPVVSPGQLVIKFDDEEKLIFQCTPTGGWGAFQTQSGGQITLEAGIYQLKVEMINPGMNIDAIIFTML